MSRRSSKQNEPRIDRAASRSRAIAALVLLGLLIALASNVYLAHLFVRVHRASPDHIDSFCNVNESINCITVSASRYASVFKVPVAVLGAEYFGLTALIVVLSLAGWWRIRNWESLVLWSMLIAFPISALMAFLAVFRVRSLCLLCSAVYLANLGILMLLLLAHRKRLKSLLTEGPRELWQALQPWSAKAALALLLLVGVSQVLWVPPLMGKPRAKVKQHRDPLAGLVKSGLTVGRATAPVKIAEFSDFECSACRTGHETLVQLLKRHGDKIYFEHHDYPLDQACNRTIDRPFHANACKAALYARCAAAQDKFWPYASLLFHNQHGLVVAELERFATQAGVNIEKLNACVKEPAMRRKLLGDIEDGIRRKVRGTPTFFVNGTEVVGPRSVDWWDQKIAELTAPTHKTVP